MKTLLLLLLSIPLGALAQEVVRINGQPCGIHGAAKAGSEVYYLNSLKNRYTFPQKSDFDRNVTISRLLQSADPGQFSPQRAVRVQAYVLNVKVGGVESCNCRTKDPQYRDTHIELTPDESHTAPQYRLIAEVTPRLRQMMAKRGLDWSTDGLRKQLKGRRVTITGWLLYDAEHESGAAANDPADAIGATNWRGTCWEIHPITAIDLGNVVIADEPDVPNNNTGTPAAQPGSNAPQGDARFTYVLAGVAVLILLLLILLYTRRRR